jgi:hypothetical protein
LHFVKNYGGGDVVRCLLVRVGADRSVPLVLIKKNICKVLEPKLTRDGFRVLNRGCLIPFPASGQQKKFHEQFGAIIANATEG